MTIEPLAIYIHWPYCKSKCPYCDFFKRVQKNVPQDNIVDFYLKELNYYHRLLPDRIIRSVFFGGGTPSLIAPDNINRLLEHIFTLWKTEANIEISLEANPNSEYPDMFRQLRRAGINRLSLGVQALNDNDLRFLGRTHNLKQALHSIDEVLKNFDNHSIDLIYARPKQSLSNWIKELEQASGFGFKHLSLYQLTIEEGTFFCKKNVQVLDEDAAADMYLYTVDYLQKHGYPRYEVSNFAPARYESVHNKCYWLGDDYIGIGESAHGRLKINGRFYAIDNPPGYMQHTRRHKEILTPQERAEELVIMGLRLQRGIDKKHFKTLCGLNFDDFINQKAAANLKEQGLITNNSAYLAATNAGFLVLNHIIAQLCR